MYTRSISEYRSGESRFFRDFSLNPTKIPGSLRSRSAVRGSRHIPTRCVSEGAAFVPQETCGIPRSRFGLVWPFPLALVAFSE